MVQNHSERILRFGSGSTMKPTKYKVEYKTGPVKMNSSNVIIQDALDMDMIEFWEQRLRDLNQPFLVAYRKIKIGKEKKIAYSVFADMRKRQSPFG